MPEKTNDVSSSILSQLSSIAAASDIRPHLVTFETEKSGHPLVTAHSAAPFCTRAGRKAILADMKGCGFDAHYKVLAHSEKEISKARSLEQLLNGYGEGGFLYDPTGGFTRSSLLVAFSRKVRELVGEGVSGIYWQSRWQAVYVVLNKSAFFHDKKIKIVDLADIESKIHKALDCACADVDKVFVKSIRIGFEFPRISLVPVDKASYHKTEGFLSTFRGHSLASALAMAIGVGSSASVAASEPAVSEPNGKLAILGGSINSDNDNLDGDVYGAAGSYTFPLNHSSGLQFDGFVGSVDDEAAVGAGVHLFLRDPSKGMLGIVGSYTSIERDGFQVSDQEVGLVGIEGELYLEDFTVAANLGHQFGDNIEEGGYGILDLSWYATDDLMLSIGAATNPDVDDLARVSVEFQPAISGFSGLTLFADGAFGDNDFESVTAGIRFYFGSNKSLKYRHRKDDPVSNLPLTALKIGSSTTGY